MRKKGETRKPAVSCEPSAIRLCITKEQLRAAGCEFESGIGD